MTDGHTLVIPTYNRPQLLKRLIQYYHQRASWMNLLVLDSSGLQVVQENAKALSVYGESVRHVVFEETVAPASKFLRGLALVQTPYASFCADDDLVFPDGLRQAIVFLERHSDYAGAHGLYLNIRQKDENVHVTSEYAGPSIEASHPGARIFQLFQNYESMFYATFRTPDLQAMFSAIPTFPALLFQELFQSVAALIQGKIRRLPIFYAARQAGPPAQPGRDKWNTYYWFADNPAEVLEQYRAYCGEIWKFYEQHAAAPRLDQEQLFRTLDLAHAVYFSSRCSPRYFHSVLRTYWPGDRYRDIRGVDLFDHLAPAGRPRQTVSRFWKLLWPRLQNQSLGIGLGRLNREARNTCRRAWKCHLPVRLHWLAHVRDFRETYLELCRYLDQN